MKRSYKIALAVIAPIVVGLMYVFADKIIYMSRYFGVCTFHLLTGYYCPGCGNTRCVKAMLHGHFLTAIRNNASLPFLAVLLLLLYIELLFDIFGKPIKLLPRKMWLWFTVIGVFCVYFVVRNFIPEIAPIPA